jgi:hypothetical protein
MKHQIQDKALPGKGRWNFGVGFNGSHAVAEIVRVSPRIALYRVCSVLSTEY